MGVRRSPCQLLYWFVSRYPWRPSRPGICATIARISVIPTVPTTAAALLRVTVESSTPMQTTVSSGIKKHPFAANTSRSAFGADTTVPE